MNLKFLFAGLLPLLLGACVGNITGTTQPSSFYALNSVDGAPVAGLPEQYSIGLGPLFLPDAVERPHIVTRPDANRVVLAEFDRWAGDLGKDLKRVLAQNLLQRLGHRRVAFHPWSPRQQPSYQVSVRFFHFDGRLDGDAHLEGVWRVLNPQSGCEVHSQHFNLLEPAGGGRYTDLVAAMSRAVGAISDDLATALAARPTDCN